MIAECLASPLFDSISAPSFCCQLLPLFPWTLPLCTPLPCPYCQADPPSSSIPITASLLGWPLHPRSSEKP